MGIGLVDPILPSIAKGLDATPSQVSLLFTSYFLITAVAMLVTGFVSSRIGGKKTLLAGLALVVVFAALAGTSNSVGELVGFRAGWGLGNALFVSTALAVIVGAAAGGSAAAILLYESALGLGMACGPLLGAVLGDMKWRYPFFGTAALMAIGFVAITAFLKEQPRPARKTSLLDPIKALGHGGLASAAASAFFYNYAFFTVLAFTPFVLNMSPYKSGGVFFAWGVLLAVFSVLVAPRLQERFGSLKVLGGSLVLLAADLIVLGYGNHTTAVAATIASGAFIGLNNTVYTELALGVSDAPRPVASAGYNFVRWFAAAAAPYFAPKIEEWSDIHIPFVVAALAAVVGAVIVWARRTSLTRGTERRPAQLRRTGFGVRHERSTGKVRFVSVRAWPTARGGAAQSARAPNMAGRAAQNDRGAAQSSGTDLRSGSRRSVPLASQRSSSSCAPRTRFHAASFVVIGSSGRKRTGSIGASSSRSSTRPPGSATRTELNGAPGHSGSPRSSEAPGATTRPSTCGEAASTASGRSTLSVSASPARTDRTSSARGPFTGSASAEVGSAIGWADMPSVAYRTMSPSVKRSTSMRSVPRKVTAARASGSPSAVRSRASTRARTSTMGRA